jgi:hypothetical protein
MHKNLGLIPRAIKKDPNGFEETNKQLNEVRKTKQDVKGEFNKDIEILKKKKSHNNKLKLRK